MRRNWINTLSSDQPILWHDWVIWFSRHLEESLFFSSNLTLEMPSKIFSRRQFQNLTELNQYPVVWPAYCLTWLGYLIQQASEGISLFSFFQSNPWNDMKILQQTTISKVVAALRNQIRLEVPCELSAGRRFAWNTKPYFHKKQGKCRESRLLHRDWRFKSNYS